MTEGPAVCKGLGVRTQKWSLRSPNILALSDRNVPRMASELNSGSGTKRSLRELHSPC